MTVIKSLKKLYPEHGARPHRIHRSMKARKGLTRKKRLGKRIKLGLTGREEKWTVDLRQYNNHYVKFYEEDITTDN